MKMMHGVAVAGLMAAMTLAAGAQTSTTVKDDLFAGTEVFAKNATDINEVTMDPGTLGMVDGSNKAKARRTVLSVVRSYSYDKPGMYRIEDVDAFRNKLNTGDWHCSVHTRNMKSGESTDVCNKTRTDDMSETAIITVEPKELTFIHTIRRKSSGEGGPGMSESNGYGFSYGMDPGVRAEMAISMAEMHAQMAEMRAMQPGMMGMVGPLVSLDMPSLKMNLRTSLRGKSDGETLTRSESMSEKKKDKDKDKNKDLNKDQVPE